jgi:acyl carrier protein
MNGTGALEQDILAILRERMALDVPSTETDLLATGYIDSLLLAELLAHLEEELGIRVHLDDLDLDQLRTVADMARFVGRRLPPGAAAAKGAGSP